MSDRMSPYNILAAVNRIRAELPTLVDADGWSRIGPDLDEALAALRSSRAPAEQEDLADRIVELLNAYEQANARFNAEIAIQDAVKNDLAGELAAIAARLSKGTAGDAEPSLEAAYYTLSWSFDPTDLPVPEVDRSITIRPGGLKGGKSVKFSNLRLDLGEMSELAGGAMLAGFNAIDEAHPLVMVAGVLLTIRALMKAMTIELTENEASVFWGFVHARNTDNTAPEDTIFERTNTERQRYGLDALRESQFRNALAALEQLKCIEKSQSRPVYWRIVEKYRIQS
jgi:hypothetical protein